MSEPSEQSAGRAIVTFARGWQTLVAVQWHPELAVGNIQQQKLMRVFVREAKKK